MNRTDAMKTRGGSWSRVLAWGGGVTVLGAVVWGAQQMGGPDDANAQAPIRRSGVARGTTTQSTAGPTRSTSRAPVGNAAEATAGPKRQVVAEVNNERITRTELGNDCLRRHGDEVLDSIVNRQVILQACQRRKIVVGEAEVTAEVATTAKRFRMDVPTWLAMLKKERDIAEQQYRREIIWPMLALRKLAQAQLVVSPDEVRKALEAEYGPKVRARIISVTTEAKAKDLHAKAKANPAIFGDLAKEHSEDPNSASARGLIPPIRMHVGNPEIEAAAFALQDGEISDVVFVAEQYIIIKCDKQVAQTYLTPDQMEAAKKQANSQLRDQRLRSEAAKIFAQLKDEAKVITVFGDAELQKRNPGVAAFINGQPITIDQLAEECIIRHGVDALEIEINRRLLAQALKRNGKTVSREDVDYEIKRAADAYGYLKKDGSPDVQKWLSTVSDGDQSQVDVYVSDAVWPSAALKKLVSQNIDITPEDLQKGYEANFGERVQVLAIMMSNSREAQKVWDMARNNPTDEFFGELASQYSIEPVSKANFGNVPPIRRHSGQKNLETEAFRLRPGELSELIAVGPNYIILRCLGRTKPMVAIDAVKDELHKDLHEKKLRIAMNDAFDRLKEASRVRNHLAPRKPRTVVPASATSPIKPRTVAPSGTRTGRTTTNAARTSGRPNTGFSRGPVAGPSRR